MADGTTDGSAPRAGDPAAELASSAFDLIAALWRTTPPELRSDAPSAQETVAELAATLLRIAADAERLAQDPSRPEHGAARCLAETATAIRTVIGDQPAGTADTVGVGGTLPSSVRLRLARMERWLAERASTDTSAEPSANLCLWVLECLEERAG